MLAKRMIVLALLFPSGLTAEPFTICDGKYADSAALVETALEPFGTLYSGGLHHQGIETVGETLDLYRLWRGLPDAGLRKAEDLIPHYGEPNHWSSNFHIEDPNVIWERAQWATTPAIRSDPELLVGAAWGFDTLTSVGPAVDWWRRAEDFDDLTDMQREVARLAKTEPALDWMQSALAASDAPWANHWHLSSGMHGFIEKAYRRLSAADFTRFEAGDGIEWLVTAALNSPDARGRSPVDTPLTALGERVADCTATPSEHAAYTVAMATRARATGRESYAWSGSPNGPLPAGIAPLPDSVLRRIATDRLYYLALSRRANVDLQAFRMYLPDDRAWQADVDLVQLYRADTLDAVPVSKGGYVRRAYNMLSADDLLTLGKRVGDPSLIAVAFARHIALENWTRAEALLPDLKAALPDDAALIDRINALREAPEIRLTLIAMHLPRLSTITGGGNTQQDYALGIWNGNLGLYDRYGRADPDQSIIASVRNLPSDYRLGAFMQRDFEVWLRLPQRWRAFSTMRGTWPQWIERYQRRHDRCWPCAVHVPAILDHAPFRHLIAAGEITRLAGEDRLMHTLARTILPWVAAQTDTWIERRLRALDTESEALARIIALCRRKSCGAWNGALAQDRAFRLLVGRMGKTDAAKRTRMWW